MQKHGGSKGVHERVRLSVQVTQHLVGTPPADESNDIRVNFRTEKRHGAASAEAARRDIIGRNAAYMELGDGGETKCGGDVTSGNIFPMAIGEDCVERGVRRSIVLSKMLNATSQGVNGTNEGVRNTPVANGFTRDGILLGGVGERNEARSANFIQGGRHGVKLTFTLTEGNVLKSEGIGAGLIGSTRMFTGTT